MKKIRGWKRQIKKMDQWAENNKFPSLKNIEFYHEVYCKITCFPWAFLANPDPPLWFFRLILKRMELIFYHWNQYLQIHYKNIDLQWWIFEPHYMKSRIVAAKVEKPAELRDNYFLKAKNDERFPKEKFIRRKDQSFNIKWELYYDETLMHCTTKKGMNKT